MPLYESRCSVCGGVREWYAPRSTSPDPFCCGQQMSRLVSMFRVVFTGPITARYKDRTLEGAEQDGFLAWRRRSAKDPRYPEPVRIETWEDRKRFMAEEGLEEVPSNATASFCGDGGRDVKVSTAGERGQWV